ncbi:hypothetical protein [Pedobacter chitinilyticus]|uniref:DUF4259 domain-containing protein n=1 Tax=Pedobacter chitinilyticus TaxID=2233776 RepID=A0A443Z2B4_9SPHI|nr:hypothetical protein [Pedobacter chitinilyticus]RWU10639.1 hypothetical protein DPV69_04685 [Pedobacter chitinilyticus]
MGNWGTGVKDNDVFADIYSEFFDQYNSGARPEYISKKIIETHWEILEIEHEKNSLWFALGQALWETKSLDTEILKKIESVINTGEELAIWLELGASEIDIKKRRIALEKFLQKLKSDRPKAKPRKRIRLRVPIFAAGDCLCFKMSNGNYGGAVVLAADYNPETAYNLVATTRINQLTKPTLKDFENSEVLICNFGSWEDKPEVTWYMPDLYFKAYAELYEVVGRIPIDAVYDVKNYRGDDYLFQPSFTSGWKMNYMIEKQLESEETKPKPLKSLKINRFI